jgi:hypothetical protein
MAHLPAIAASTAYTLSIHAKAAENRYLQVALDDGNVNGAHATFDLQTGIVSGPLTAHGTGVIGVASIQPVGNGFYRCAITTTIGAATSGRALFVLSNAANPGFAPGYAGNAANGLLIWGAQLEQGAFATSYIPTTAAAVTRAIDVCWMPTAAWYNPSAFSLSMECYGPNGQGALAGFSDLTFGNSLYFSTDATPTAVAAYPFGAGPAGILMGSRAGVNKFCCSVTTTRIAFSCDGVSPTSVVIATAPFAPTSLALGNDPWSRSTAMDGWLRRARVWSRALSDSELQAVTLLDPPTLDLVFSGPTLDPRLTFTRASTATYFDSSGVIQTAATNAPRFDYDPMSHVLRGLLIEEQRANLVAPSVPDVVSGHWSLSGPTTQGGSVTAPDNTTATLSLIAASDTTNAIRNIAYATGVAVAPSTAYSLTAFLRKSTTSNAYIQMNIAGGATVVPVAYYDLTNGTAIVGADIIAGATNLSASIAPVGNGWFRVGFTFTTTATSGGLTPYIGPCTTVSVSGDNRSAVGVVGQGIYVWGLQVEQGAFPTSYIATTAAAVTRSADSCTMPTSSFVTNALSFSYAVEGLLPTSGAGPIWVELDDGTAANRSLLTTSTINLQYFQNIGGVTTTNNASLGNITPGAVFKSAVSTASTQHKYALNGAVSAPDPNVANPPPVTTLGIGRGTYIAGSSYIRRVRYWSRALSNSELQSVTT